MKKKWNFTLPALRSGLVNQNLILEFQRPPSDPTDRLLQTNRRVFLPPQLDREGRVVPERNRTDESGYRVPDLRRRAEHGLQVAHPSVLHFRHRVLLQGDQDWEDVWKKGEYKLFLASTVCDP